MPAPLLLLLRSARLSLRCVDSVASRVCALLYHGAASVASSTWFARSGPGGSQGLNCGQFVVHGSTIVMQRRLRLRHPPSLIVAALPFLRGLFPLLEPQLNSPVGGAATCLHLSRSTALVFNWAAPAQFVGMGRSVVRSASVSGASLDALLRPRSFVWTISHNCISIKIHWYCHNQNRVYGPRFALRAA